mgnify:CR=1 FL=1
MFVKRVMIPSFGTNCYIVGCEETKQALVIDPGGQAESVLQEAEKAGYTITQIVLTHGHADHMMEADKLKMLTGGAPIAISEEDAFMLENPMMSGAMMFGMRAMPYSPDSCLKDGDRIEVGNLTLDVLYTPGHTPGGICLYTPGYLFSGDTLFERSVGRADLPGGSMDALQNSIKTKLFVLPDETVVYPGHGMKTTIGEEKAHNPFVR